MDDLYMKFKDTSVILTVYKKSQKYCFYYENSNGEKVYLSMN